MRESVWLFCLAAEECKLGGCRRMQDEGDVLELRKCRGGKQMPVFSCESACFCDLIPRFHAKSARRRNEAVSFGKPANERRGVFVDYVHAQSQRMLGVSGKEVVEQ